MAKKKDAPVVAYKGFNKNWQCRDYQFEVGKTFEHDGEVQRCESGFHACEYPLDVFSYYQPSDSKFAVVKMDGELSREEGGDSKIASAKITIEAEMSIPTLVQRAVGWIMSHIDKTVSVCECQSAATNTGNRSAATNTGDWSAATNTGDWSAATNTGNRSAATNTGDWSAADVTGKSSVAIASGRKGKAKASEGSAIVLFHYDEDGNLIKVFSGIAGQDSIKPDTWYTLNESGELFELEE